MRLGASRIVAFCFTMCILGSVFSPLFVDLQNTDATPVIIGEEYGGRCVDNFNDSSGVENSNNVTIETTNVSLSTSSTTSILWDYVYTADAEPDTVGWGINEDAVGDLASASGGFLTLDTTAEDAHWYYNYNWGATNALGAIFESRMKVVSNNQIGVVIWLRDGTYYEGIKFYTDRIEMHIDTFNKYYMDTTDDFHVYRFTVKNNDYMVYVDGVLVINGTGQHTTPTGGNVCEFGDTTDTPGYESISIWDYCRYNTSGPFLPNYNYCTSGNIISTEIFLPGGMTWSMVNINKTEPGTDNFINVSVLDGTSFTPIPGYENLDNVDIDISSIDPIAYPSIRLYANFIGNGSVTPVLHEWSVSWHDTIPPETPTGLTINNPFTGYSLILSWDSNSEIDLDCYIVYISTDNTTFYWLTNISAGTIAFTDYGLTKGTTYYYKIAAADEVPNQSPFSEVVKGVPDLDYDGDGIGNIDDPDDDNDGTPDISDPSPLNPLNDIESTLDYINTTIDDIQTRVIIVQTILENMNLTELLNAIKYLNQTLPPKIDDLSTQLAGVNGSLLGRVTDAETNILSELANVDASLSNEIQNALVSITGDIINMNTSVSDELTTLLNTMISEHDSLQQWLDLVLSQIDSNLTTTNATLHSQLYYLDQSITNFYNNLEDNIGDVLSDLQMHDQRTGQNHTEIIGLLLDLLDGQIEKEKIEDLKTRLINLANDLSSHNQTIADDIMDVVNDIDAFEDNMNQQLIAINNTLDQLARLEEILGDLEELDQSLEQAEDNIQDSVDDRSTRDEDEERLFMIELFLIILFILLIVNLIATIMIGKKRKGEDISPEPKNEDGSRDTIPPQQTVGEGPSVSEERTPPRPPTTNRE